MKDKPKVKRFPFIHFLVAAAAAMGVRGVHDTPYSEMSFSSRYHSRYQFGFDRHKAKLQAIKNRRRTGRR